MSLRRSHGSSSRKRSAASNVAPPQHSSEWKPTSSMVSRMGSMSGVRMRVAQSDWWPSRRVVSVMRTLRARMAVSWPPGRAQARPRYSRVRVSTLMCSPCSMKRGTCTTTPVWRVAGFVALGGVAADAGVGRRDEELHEVGRLHVERLAVEVCLLYTSDAADDLLCVDLGGRRII